MKTSFVYGLVFILFGIVLLLLSYGVLTLELFKDIWKAWPVIFIIIGIAIMLSQDKIEEVKE